MIRSLPRPVAVQLLIFRAALLFGLVLLGAWTAYVKNRGTVSTMSDSVAQTFGYVFIGLTIAAITGMMLIRGRISAKQEVRTIVALYVVGYALAEAGALFGAVTWYIGGSRDWYIAGLVLMVAAFQILPVKRDA